LVILVKSIISSADSLDIIHSERVAGDENASGWQIIPY
jgi:hypothetical protein